MKKTIAILFALTLCFGITACSETQPEETLLQAETTTTQSAVEEPQPITYTYQVEPMQNAECVYYGPNAYVPNSPNPSKVQGKIMVWTQCPNCGEENIGSYAIDPLELDFSFGNTIMHSDTDSCWDCSWDRGVEQFMWAIRITRIPE